MIIIVWARVNLVFSFDLFVFVFLCFSAGQKSTVSVGSYSYMIIDPVFFGGPPQVINQFFVAGEAPLPDSCFQCDQS